LIIRCSLPEQSRSIRVGQADFLLTDCKFLHIGAGDL